MMGYHENKPTPTRKAFLSLNDLFTPTPAPNTIITLIVFQREFQKEQEAPIQTTARRKEREAFFWNKGNI